MDLNYQAAQKEDINQIFDLNQKLIDQYENVEMIDYDRVMKWVKKKIETYIHDYQAIYYEGKKVGYLYLHDEADKLELDDFYILENYRNQGIGSQVLRDCLTISTKKQRELFLYIFSKNVRAIALYQSFGFEIIKEVGQTRYIMER